MWYLLSKWPLASGVGWEEGVFQISSDRDDGRIFWGLKFSIWGFFGGFGFWFLPPFDHPCHLKSGLPPAPTHPLVFCYQSEEILRVAPTQLLGRGDRNRLIEMIALIQIRFSVIKENDFWDFGKWTQLMEVRLIQVCLQLIHPKLERPT